MNLLEGNRCAELGAVILMWISVSHTHIYTHELTHTHVELASIYPKTLLTVFVNYFKLVSKINY